MLFKSASRFKKGFYPVGISGELGVGNN